MKTFTVKNPYAYLICADIKPIENRTWPTKFRGRILIHSSAKAMKEDPYALLGFEKWHSLSPGQRVLLRSNTLENSAIIGSVEIVDCFRNDTANCFQKPPSIWGEKDCFNWVLTNPVLFANPITNVKGRLSFWDYQMTEEEYLNIEKM